MKAPGSPSWALTMTYLSSPGATGGTRYVVFRPSAYLPANIRGSNANGLIVRLLILAKSGCAGLISKLRSSGTSAEGVLNTAVWARLTQASPSICNATGAG